LLFCQEVSAHGQGIRQIKGYSAGKYQFMNEESPGRIVIRRELSAQERGIQQRNGIPPEIASSYRREIHLKNGIPPGITSSWTLIQTGKIKLHEQSSEQYTISGPATPNPLHCECQLSTKI
jgi:hypothetical protein